MAIACADRRDEQAIVTLGLPLLRLGHAHERDIRGGRRALRHALCTDARAMRCTLSLAIAAAFGCAKDPASPPSDAGSDVGYRIDVGAVALDFPSDVTFDERGAAYVLQSGWRYPEAFVPPQLIELATGRVVATGGDAPWTGVAYMNGAFYVTSSGTLYPGSIYRVTRDGQSSALARLPSMGDHPIAAPIAEEGAIVFGVGAATNAGVVSEDQAAWISRFPGFHDLPCEDVVTTGRAFVTPNPFDPDPSDTVMTGAFAAFGVVFQEGHVLHGELPCTGALLRAREDGTLELVAWGLRDPVGIARGEGGSMWVIDRGFDARGSRHVPAGDDALFAITPGAWYGWPDYVNGARLPEPVLARPPSDPPKAMLHMSAPSTGLLIRDRRAITARPGMIATIDLATGEERTIAVPELKRPTSLRAGPDGALWVTDFGDVLVNVNGVHPRRHTGSIWKIRAGSIK